MGCVDIEIGRYCWEKVRWWRGGKKVTYDLCKGRSQTRDEVAKEWMDPPELSVTQAVQAAGKKSRFRIAWNVLIIATCR
jgi:hypothetical protein